MATDAQDVLIGAGIELGRDLGIDQRLGQRPRRALGRLQAVEVDLEAVGDRPGGRRRPSSWRAARPRSSPARTDGPASPASRPAGQ